MSIRKPTVAEVEAYAGHFVLHGHMSDAFRAAFPKSKATAETINKMANIFNKLPEIRGRVAELAEKTREVAEKKFGLDVEYVCRRLKEMDELDILDIMNEEMTGFKPLPEWPKAWRTSISGIDLMAINSGDDVEALVKKIKWPDKTKNIELIGKLGSVQAFTENVRATHKHITDNGNDEW